MELDLWGFKMEYKEFEGKQVRIVLKDVGEIIFGKALDTYNHMTIVKEDGKNAIVNFNGIAMIEEV